MIFGYFSKNAPPFPQIESSAAENLIPSRRGTERVLEIAP